MNAHYGGDRRLCIVKSFGSMALVATLLGTLLLALFAPPLHAEEVPETSDKGQTAAQDGRYALLVGCSNYDHLDPTHSLKGPPNDVILLRNLLTGGKFQFPNDHVRVLADIEGSHGRPTRSNIENEFERLAKTAKKEDQVVILLAGHGSQQPDQQPPQPGDPESDGRDEIYLPCDVKTWDEGIGKVEGAIVDDELNLWTGRILENGCRVCVIMDCCCSGTGLRGTEEVRREVDPKDVLGVPSEALDRPGVEVSGGERPETQILDSRGALVAIYGAQSHEPTVERKMPPGEGQGVYGLLTFTLCQVLEQSVGPLSYRGLMDRVHGQYAAWHRYSPTPDAEGTELDREVFGSGIQVSRTEFVLSRAAKTSVWIINGGQLHGLSEKSVLAVYPPAGAPDADKTVGYLKVIHCDLHRSQVEPCAFNNMLEPTSLEPSSRCVPAHLDYGDFRVVVAVDKSGDDNTAALDSLEIGLRKLSETPGALFAVAEPQAEADWTVRSHGRGVELLPASAAQLVPRDAIPEDTPRFVRNLDEGPDRIAQDLTQIAKAANLIDTAQKTRRDTNREVHADSADSLRVRLETLRFRDRDDQTGTSVAESDPHFAAGERIGWRITNTGRRAADVTLLFVDSRCGIHAIFPEVGSQSDNRLGGGNKSVIVGPYPVNADTVGREQVVLIAVRAEGPRVDFSTLAQPTLESGRGGGDSRGVRTPLGRLLENALFTNGDGVRGLGSTETVHCSMDLQTWNVVSTPPK